MIVFKQHSPVLYVYKRTILNNNNIILIRVCTPPIGLETVNERTIIDCVYNNTRFVFSFHQSGFIINNTYYILCSISMYKKFGEKTRPWRIFGLRNV